MSISTDPIKKQKLILEKLMQNINKPILIPEKCKDREPPKPPEFVRNIMGSSAGAGSAEFHLYRNLRKRDMIRQEIMNNQIIKEKKDKEYNEMIEGYRKEEEGKTIKRRAKRLKRKMKLKEAKKKKSAHKNNSEASSQGESSCNSDEETHEDPLDMPLKNIIPIIHSTATLKSNHKLSNEPDKI